MRWRPRRRRGGGGGCGRHGATRNSFKPAPGDDAAARRPPAEPPGDCGEEARRGLRVERSERRGRRERGRARLLRRTGARLRTAPRLRPPARAPPRPAGLQREQGGLGVPAAASLKSLPPLFPNGGAIQAAALFFLLKELGEKPCPAPQLGLLISENV